MGYNGLLDEQARRAIVGNAINAVAVGNTVDVLKITIRRGRVVVATGDPTVSEATPPTVA